MKAQVNKIRLTVDEQGNADLVLSLHKPNLQKIKQDLAKLKQRLEKGKTLSVEIKEYREQRSLDANAYFHVLVGKMAEKLRIGTDECKRNLVLDYGTLARDENGMIVGFTARECVPITQFFRYAKAYKLYEKNGKTFIDYLIYKETHTLDKVEMARLIDGTVEEAKQLGIETKTPQEIAEMMSLTEGL